MRGVLVKLMQVLTGSVQNVKARPQVGKGLRKIRPFWLFFFFQDVHCFKHEDAL